MWTAWIVSDGDVVSDPSGAERRLDSSDITHLTYIDEVFLPQAQAQGVIDQMDSDSLSGFVARLIQRAHQAPLTAEIVSLAESPSREQDVEGRPPVTAGAVASAATARPEPVVREPGPLQLWWERSRMSIGSDLAVHGLAYLGVLLLFVGAFGLVAFAFGGVQPTWRPVAELAIAAVPFFTAAILLRRGAVIVGRSLELAGGLLLPVMVMTVFLDDVPPDLDGVAMLVVMSLALLAIGAGYAAWSRRHSDSALRFVAAPLVWLAAGIAAMGVSRDLPAGAAVASLTAAQVTAVALALAATLAIARRRPDDRLAEATLTSGVPGAVVVAVMAGLTWLAEDFPPVPVLLTGVAGLVVVDLLDCRVPSRAVAVIQPMWWAVVSAALLVSLDAGPAGAVAAVGFCLLLERTARRRSAGLPLALCTMGMVVGFAVTAAQPWYGVWLAIAGSVWAGWRRLRPIAVDGETRPETRMDLAAGLVPLVGLVWLGAATDTLVVPSAVGAGLALLAAVVAARGLLRRDPSDGFWTTTWVVASALATAVVLLAWGLETPPQSLTWVMPVSAALLMGASAVGPMPATARPWAVMGFGTLTWVLLGTELGLSVATLAVALAVAALAVVVTAHLAQSLMTTDVAGSLALAGHVLGLGALLAAGSGVALAVAAGAATAGFVVTSVVDAYGKPPIAGLVTTTEPLAHYLAPTVAAVGLPVTTAATMDASGIAWSDPWPLTALLAVTSVGYGLLARVPLPVFARRSVAAVASVAALLAAASASDRPTALVGLAALVSTVWLLPVALRVTPMVWIAWAALAPFVGLLARQISVDAAALPTVEVAAAALVGVGGVLTLAGLAIDRTGSDGSTQWRLRRPDLYPVVVTGSVEVIAGLLLTVVAVPVPGSGWLTLVVAAVVLGAAVLHRMGVLAGVAAVLAWIAVMVVTGEAVLDGSWVALLVAVGLLVLADVSRTREMVWWARWDLSLFVAAHVVVATGLVSALDTDERPLVLTAVGVLALAVAARLRGNALVAVGYAAAGLGLVLIGAVDAGPGWTSVAMLGIAAGCVLVAARMADSPTRWWLQVGGALAAVVSWQQATLWWELSAQSAADLTAVGVGVLVLALAVALAARPTARSWTVTWGGVATLVGGTIGLAALAELEVTVSVATVAGGVLLVLGWVVVAEAMNAARLRYGPVLLLVLVERQVLSLVNASPATQVAVLVTTAGVAALVALAPVVIVRLRAWQRPVLALGVLGALGATGVAADQLPDRVLLAPSLLVCAGVAAAASVALSSVWLRVLSPLLACAAWVVFAAESMGANPQWYTVPMGLALLVAVGLLRQDARSRGANPASRGIVTLEVVGVAFVVGASFVQAVTDSLAHVALAILLGVGVVAWGLLTKVRRRVLAGGAVVLAAAVVLLAVPLVSLLPGWEGTTLWILLAGAGLVALLAATAIEKGRIVVHRALERYVALGGEWE